ncbi:MAG TPA: AraC family transcriptional regulator [Chthoniobacteraceae bacterium]|nr:AraC family transcriptional regulator [Chthoniobacteraceae bacterium]
MKLSLPPFSGIHLDLLEINWRTPVNWNYSDLRAPYWRLYWNGTPGMYLRCGGREMALEPDRLVLIPPETSFAAHTRRAATHFYVHFLTFPFWREHEATVLAIWQDQRRFLKRLVAGDPAAAPRWRIMALVAESLEQLPAVGWNMERPASERVRAAVEMIEAMLPQAAAVGEIARRVGMNLNAFIRLFREETGKTPGAFVMERRLASACLLLHHTGRSIERIAEECGFCDRHHLTRTFTRHRGISPAAFRSQSRLVPMA